MHCTYKDKGKDGSDNEIFLDKVDGIEALLQARVKNVYGQQRDYFDQANWQTYNTRFSFNEEGWAEFYCPAASVSVWVEAV